MFFLMIYLYFCIGSGFIIAMDDYGNMADRTRTAMRERETA